MKKSSFYLPIFLLSTSLLYAQPTTQAQAKKVVANWLNLEAKPLSTSIGTTIAEISTFTDNASNPLYHIVNLSPNGYVIVSGDDLVEPIIGFVPYGSYVDSFDNPLGALVKNDIPSRIAHERVLEEQRTNASASYVSNSYGNIAKDKWDYLYDTDKAIAKAKVESISNMYVEPFIQTLWSQQKETGGNNCYNLYTPNNYPSGCVATAFSQILRYFEYPNSDVGTASFDITVDGAATTKSLLGGDGSGGVYDWGIMSYGPTISDANSRTAIGRLMNDTGISVNMSYTSSGSGASINNLATSLVDTFSYTNTIYGNNYNNGAYDNIETADRDKMINTNLDAGLPVALGIKGTGVGHAILSDGYGYNASTQYHHLNMGWSGSQNAWYNLPNIDDDYYGFTSVSGVVYNIYQSNSGEIVSGRIIDSSGNPIEGASVNAGNGHIDTTDAKGIYALTYLPSNATYTIDISKDGYLFDSQTVEVGISAGMEWDGSEWSTSVGNKWAINFTGSEAVIDDIYEENDDYISAYDIGNLEQTWLSGIQADEVWYKIYVHAGSERVKIDLQFSHADGDIDLALTNANGDILEASDSATDNEFIDYTVPLGDVYYYIWVHHGNAGNSYNLWWDDISQAKGINPAIINYLLN